MTGDSLTPEQAPRNGLKAPEGASSPGVGTPGGSDPPPGPQTGAEGFKASEATLAERYAAAIRAAAHDCDGECGQSEEECRVASPIQVAAYHFDAIATVYGTPEALAAAVARLDGRHIAFEVARELGRQVPELPELRDEVARLEAELVAARSALDRVRECLPAIQHALEKLPATCRYHDDTTPHGSWREACCDTGIAPRRRQLAEQALAALTS